VAARLPHQDLAEMIEVLLGESTPVEDSFTWDVGETTNHQSKRLAPRV
jgi:hypothetical protein